MTFRDHFAPQAADYASFRPTYPAEFVAHIASLAPGHELAWDVGTGSGQAAILLAEHFSRVHASDASARQVQYATPHPRVDYLVAPAEASGLVAQSVDLVAVAQALHWFANADFYAEVDRVLKPGGVLAAWTYNMVRADEATNAVVDWFYGDRVGKYWPAERHHVETGYRELDFPYPEIATGEWRITARFNREQLIGYISTWSALRHARDAEDVDPLEELRSRLERVWGEAETRDVWWDIVVRAGRKPIVAAR